MNTPATSQLLVRDRQNLDRVAIHLRNDESAFFGIICKPTLTPVVIQYLREKSDKDVPLPKHLAKQEEMLGILSELEVADPSTVVSVHLSAADGEPWTALNWNREKLLRGGRLLLFMDSIDDLAVFHSRAPDAYAFREAVFLVEGADAGTKESSVEPDEPHDVRTARALYELRKDPVERAEAAIRWGKALLKYNQSMELLRVTQQALALVPRARFNEVSHRRVRIVLYDLLMVAQVHTGQLTSCYKTAQCALQDIGDDLAERMISFKLHFQLTAADSPLEVGRDIRQWDTDTLPDASIRNNVHRALISSEASRGHFQAAFERCNKRLAGEHSIAHRADCHCQRAHIHRWRGHFRQARGDLMHADLLLLRGGLTLVTKSVHDIWLLLEEGELAAAQRLVASSGVDLNHSAVIAIKSGDVSGGIAKWHTSLQRALADRKDSTVFSQCLDFAAFLASVPSLTRADLDQAYETMRDAGQKLIDLANHEPVWYDVLIPGLRAQMLALYPDRHDEAMDEAKLAVSLAQSKWPQALARSRRIYVKCLARAGFWSKMLPEILNGMQAARDEDDLMELATLRAYDLVRFIKTNARKNKVDDAQQALANTFVEMDAPRVEGQTWLEIERYLPLDGALFDVVPIAERIFDSFTDMPMPEQASRAIEWLGDAYAARGQAKKAEGAYRMALGPLVRHGFVLRQTLIREKLELLG